MRRKETAWLQLRISQPLKARMEIQAGSRGMSDWVRVAIEQRLEREEAPNSVHPQLLRRRRRIVGSAPLRQKSMKELADEL